ncbi:myophilin-like [Centruroides sculpturatus]|uniref:myophilin-like n=1 Tax=Centruroides sculpturatus TaxID=218467 RepID=UPI000C6DF2C2|nr:myophilin-like [Centruroides sculpturatus]
MPKKEEPQETELQPHQRDGVKEGQILVWIWNLLEEAANKEYDQFLRDGTVLCRLMNAIKPNCIPGEITAGDNIKHKKKNIEKFLKACSDYGVSKDTLFEPDDLLFMRHLPKVTRCLFALGKVAEEDPNFDGHKLGDEPFEAVKKTGRRRSGMPFGDDINVAHVDVKNILHRLPSVDQNQ